MRFAFTMAAASFLIAACSTVNEGPNIPEETEAEAVLDMAEEATTESTQMDTASDPYLWMEEVEGEAA